ncbi:MAG: hypothetical protein JSS07_09945 [Proteobacteria bacterium]|nr:hypothetical protein [Pseudomonadota bacterium]
MGNTNKISSSLKANDLSVKASDQAVDMNENASDMPIAAESDEAQGASNESDQNPQDNTQPIDPESGHISSQFNVEQAETNGFGENDGDMSHSKEGSIPAELTLEDIENMYAAEAGAEQGGHSEDLLYFSYGLPYGVDSIPRDLGIGLFSFGNIPVYIPVIPPPVILPTAPPINLIPEGHNDLVGANGEALTFYEEALPKGTTPGSFPLEISGNVLSNDILGDLPDTFTNLTFPGAQVVKSGDVWTIDNGHAILTLYVEDTGTHLKGDFSYQLYNNVLEPDNKGPIELQDIYTYAFMDATGDLASAEIIASIVDDKPLISLTSNIVEPTATVDEHAINVPQSADFSGGFTDIVNFGADGPAASSPKVINYALSISSPGVDSGLVDSATHQNIFLTMNGNVVEGHVGNIAGALAFMVSVDSNSGIVTLTQERGIVQSIESNPDTNEPVFMTLDSLIQLTRSETVTDGDGDSATASAALNIASNLIFKDVGPTVSVNTTGVEPNITVDEHALNVSSAANFSSNFSDSINYAADGPAAVNPLSISYALSISSPGVDSGLIDSATHQNIFLTMNGNVVEGHVGNIAGALAFIVSVDSNSGIVTLTQERGIVQSIESNPDTNEPVFMTLDSLIQLTRSETVTDGDGDSATASAALNIASNLIFKDVGPTVTVNTVGSAPTLTVDENFLAVPASANFSANFTDTINYNADGPAASSPLTTSYSLSISSSGVDSGLIDTATGQHVLLTLVGGVVQGRTSGSNDLVFTLFINSSTGVASLDQLRAVKQLVASNPDTNEAITLASAGLIGIIRTDTVTDGDGDSATNTASLNIGQSLFFKDSGPSFTNVNDPNHDNSIDIVAQNPSSTTANTVQLADWIFRADGSGANPALQSVTGNVQVVSSSPTQVTLNFLDASSNIVATMILNANGTDSIEFFHRKPTIVEVSLATGNANPGGPEPLKFIDNAGTNLHVEITADNNQLVNPSTQGWAVNNNLIDSGEGIIFSFTQLSNPAHPPLPVQEFQFDADGFTKGKNTNVLHLIVTLDNNTTQQFNVSVQSGQVIDIKSLNGQLVVSVDQVIVDTVNTTHLIDSVDVENLAAANGSFRLNGVNVFAQSTSPPPDLNYDFTLQITDGDGDFATQAFSLLLQGVDTVSSPGYTVDGPIAGATIFQDLNANGVLDAGEASTLSSATGAYNIMLVDANLDGSLNHLDGRLESIGGTDIQTGLSYNIPLFAPIGSQVITPLTSILEMQLEHAPSYQPQLIMANLVNALGLAQGTDLTEINPTQGSNIALEEAAAIMTLSIQLSSACAQILGMSQAQMASYVYLAIGDELLHLPNGTHADFSNADFINGVIGDLSQQLGLDAHVFDPIENLLMASQTALETSLNHLSDGKNAMDTISAIQQLTQGTLSDAISSFYHGDISAMALNDMAAILLHYDLSSADYLNVENEAKPELVVGNVLENTIQNDNAPSMMQNDQNITSFKYYDPQNHFVEAAAGQMVITHEGAHLTINTDGSFSYLPGKNRSFNEMIEYTAKDSHGKQEISSLSIHTADIAPDFNKLPDHASMDNHENYIVDISEISQSIQISMKDLGIQTALTHMLDDAKGVASAETVLNSMTSGSNDHQSASSPTLEHANFAPPSPIEMHTLDQHIQQAQEIHPIK